MKFILKNYWLLIIVLLVKIVLQLAVVNPVYELQRDEFLHLAQANHLAFGYISVPPFTSWVSVIINALGGGIFWVRFFPALFGALTILFAWLIVDELKGGIFAKLLLATAMIFSVYLRLNILYQPNSFDILAWTMIYFFLVRYINTEKPKWLYWLAVAMAFGFLNKYNVVFLAAGLLGGLLLTPQRKIFKRREFYYALGILFLMLLPNIVWQILHRFPVIHHMEALNKNQLENVSRAGFLMSQLKVFSWSLPVVISALVALGFGNSFKPYRVVVLSFIITLTVFCALRAKDYYAFGLYPVLLAFGSVSLEKALSKGYWRWLRPVVIASNIVFFCLILPYIIPILSPEQIVKNPDVYRKLGALRWEDGKDHQLPQDYADMLGWKEMAEKAKQAYLSIPDSERSETLIFCDNYGQAGAVNYYNRNKIPEAYAFNTDYIFWIPKMNRIKNIVLIGERPNDKVVKLFESVTLTGTIENSLSREYGTGIYILKGSVPSFADMFYKVAEKRIKDFDIF